MNTFFKADKIEKIVTVALNLRLFHFVDSGGSCGEPLAVGDRHHDDDDVGGGVHHAGGHSLLLPWTHVFYARHLCASGSHGRLLLVINFNISYKLCKSVNSFSAGPSLDFRIWGLQTSDSDV